MRVAQLWRYPVKSLQGERLESTEVSAHGFVWDRHWSIQDADTGYTLTARREPPLLLASAAVVDGGVRITLPDGRVAGDDVSLSAWLNRRVRLVEAGETAPPGTYETPIDGEHEERSPWVTWDGPQGSFHDSTRTMVSIASTATIGDWDPRRFRQNIIVDGAGEDDLIGGSLRAGSVVLDVTKPIDRCVMVTRPQPGLDRDVDILRHINRARAGKLGIGCLVSTPGTISVGDEVSRE